MSSISNTLQTLNTSLLSEINTFNSTQASTTASTSTSARTSSDSVGVSPFAQLMQQLQQLQTTNPTEFKQVMSDGATQLQAAAAQSTDPSQVAFLNNLAAKFQTAADTGNVSAIQPQGASSGTYAPHGHHHHHAASSSSADGSTSSTGTSSTTTPTDLASLLSQLLGSGQSGLNSQSQSQTLLNSLFSAM
jgi:hypothetical protein